MDKALESVLGQLEAALAPEDLGRQLLSELRCALPGYRVRRETVDVADLLLTLGLHCEWPSSLAAQREGDSDALRALLRAFVSTHEAWTREVRVSGDHQQLTLQVPEPQRQHSAYLDHLVSLQRARLDEAGLTIAVPAAQEAPVDLERFRHSTFDDPEFQRELFHSFREEGTRQLGALRQRFARETLHSLRGSAALLGAERLVALLKNQETVLDPGSLPELEAEFQRVFHWLEQHLDSR